MTASTSSPDQGLTDATGTRERPSVLWRFFNRQRRPLSALAFFVVMITLFSIANPQVILNPQLWTAVFVSLPLSMMLAVALVFVVASGEIDLSFGSVVGLTGWAFAAAIRAGWSPVLGLLAAILTGLACGMVNGWLVTRLRLSSLVATLGMSFLLRGLINIGNQGFGIPLQSLVDTPFYNLFVGRLGGPVGLPVQMLWGLAFAALAWLLFNRHVLGARVCCVGDNPDSAGKWASTSRVTKTAAFVFMGLAGALVGVMSGLINMTFYPTAGDGYLLAVLSAVFVGGTPTWGGVGTITGAVIGSAVVGFIEVGIIAAGLSGFYTMFFYGLIIILSLLSHRFNRGKSRY